VRLLSKFDDFMKASPQKTTPADQTGELVGGSFQCQRCYVEVEEAEYFHRERLLLWLCPEGHTSHIEDIVL